MPRGEGPTRKTIEKEDWEKQLSKVELRKEHLNSIVMNFFVTEGYQEAAKAFQIESGTEPGVDLSQLAARDAIRKAVQGGQCEAAIEAVNDLNPQILEEDAEVNFHLQQQRLIELIRGGDTDEALAFAQEFLAPIGEEHPHFLPELERSVALLAFEDVATSPMADLMDTAQRQRTATALNSAILRSQSMETESQLPDILRRLLWSQDRLEERVTFPRMTDLVAATLTAGEEMVA